MTKSDLHSPRWMVVECDAFDLDTYKRSSDMTRFSKLQSKIPSATCICIKASWMQGWGLASQTGPAVDSEHSKGWRLIPGTGSTGDRGNLRHVPLCQGFSTWQLFFGWLNESLWTPSSPNKAAVPEFPLHGRFCRKLNICLLGWKLEHTDGFRELLRRKVGTLPEEAPTKGWLRFENWAGWTTRAPFPSCPSSHQSASKAFIPLCQERLIFTQESHQERAKESKEQEIYKTEKHDNMKVLINYYLKCKWSKFFR